MFDFSSLREFFSNMRTFRKIGKANSVDVTYFDASHRLHTLPGSYDPDSDTVSIIPLQKRISLQGKGLYLTKKGRNSVIASYNMACAIRPDQESQDYLTSSDVETIIKSGILNQVLKPNITLGIVGFICGIGFAAVAGFLFIYGAVML